MFEENDEHKQERIPSMDIYKFRRLSDRRNFFLQSKTQSVPNLFFEEDAQKRKRTYAILQENRSEFHSRLRYYLLIYSNPAWKLFCMIVLCISFILDTCLYTFFESHRRPLWLIIIVIFLTLVYTCDVITLLGLKLSTKWRRTLNLVEPDTYKVICDVILAVPYSLLYLIIVREPVFDFYAIAPIATAVRSYRIVEYFYNKSKQAGSNQWTAFLGQYLMLFLLSVHTSTCIWYLLAYKNFELNKIRDSWSVSAVYLPRETTFDWYFVSAYWSVMILTTNALGDLYPVTTTERIIASIAVLLGFLLTTVVFVGSLTSQFINGATRRSKYVSQLTKIKKHLSLIQMDSETTTRILRYYDDLWYQKSGVSQPKLMELLPCPLQMEICYDLNAVPLYSSLLFRKLPEAFLRRLSLAMTHRFYLQDDIVYEHNQNKTFMVCITKGVIELLSDQDDESPMISFREGTCFGEISLIYNIPARCTVKAATYVECQILEKTEFIKLMITYPDIEKEIRVEIHKRITRCQSRKEIGNTQPLTLNIYVSKDKKKSRMKCLKDKLRYLQGKIQIDHVKPEDQLDEHCLDLYIISEHKKKRTKQFTCASGDFPWILDANCYLVKYWEIYMLFVVIYISLAYPYCIGINREFPMGVSFYIRIVEMISLIANLVITSITAVRTKKEHLKNFCSILNYRMHTLGFYLDMIAIIPFEYIVTIHVETLYRDMYRDHLFSLCKGIKLCLVWRLSSFFENLERKLLLNTITIKITKYCVYIILLCYWCGIVLYMESCFVKRCSENSWFAKAMTLEDNEHAGVSKMTYPLLTSMYFASTLLLSVGYGDFSPGDRSDMGVVSFMSLYGVLLIGYCISEFSAVVTNGSRTKTSFLEVIITIDKFMKENNMHPAIKSRIMAFYELQWQYNSGVELTDKSWLDTTVVPANLRKKVLHQARFKVLTSIQFFQVKNKAYIHTLTEYARDIILPPREIVYYGGTVSRELYIIESGYCLVTSDKPGKKDEVIGPGNNLGLLGLLYGVPSVGTIVTLTHCKLISISHSAYTSALSLFPDMKEHENLLKEEELKTLEAQVQTKDRGDHLDRYERLLPKKTTKKIRSFLQKFLDDSFINVIEDYQSRKESYLKSYKKFRTLNNVALYLLMPITLKPDGYFLKTWTILRITVAFLLCLLLPIVVTMAPVFTSFNGVIVFMEIVCYMDFYLKLHIAYYGTNNQLIYHPYLTAKNYLKTAFVIDFLTCFPWYVMVTIVMPNHNEGHGIEDTFNTNHVFHCTCRLVNILQIYKLYAAFWAESIGALKRAYLMSVLQFFILTIYFLNLYTCILIMMSCRFVTAENPKAFNQKLSKLTLPGPYIKSQWHVDGTMVCKKGTWIDTKNTRERHLSAPKVYLLAYYWAATSFSGGGFGDLSAQDTSHLILSIVVLVHGVLFFGYVYARIASLKAMADQVVTNFMENLKHLEMFVSREQVPVQLKNVIMAYWKYHWKRTGGWSHQSILGKLHANLNEDAVLYVYEKTLREIPLFEDVDNSFFRVFAKKLKEQYFQKGYMVMRANEVRANVFIIYRGKVDIISDNNEVEACMGSGGIFGNIKGLSRYKTLSNVVASRNIDLLCIEGSEFYALLKSHPKVYEKVKISVDSAAKDYVLPTMIVENDGIELELKIQNLDSEEIDEEEIDEANETNHVNGSLDRSSYGSKSQGSGVIGLEYTSAAFLLFLPHRWFRSSVIPDCKWVTLMEYLILFLSYFEFMFLVYEMAFLSSDYFMYGCIVVDLLYFYKLFLDFHTGYTNRYGDYVLNPKKVRKRYFSNIYHRRRDFLANLPVCYLAYALTLRPAMQAALFCYLRIPQLFRISYVFTYQTHRKINIRAANLCVKLMTIMIWASILTHVNACLFFKLSCLTPTHCTTTNWMTKPELHLNSKYAEGNYFSLYIASLWYMINLLTITGMGDVTAQNDFEIIETIIIIIIIKFCTGLLISEMSAMISAHKSSLIAYDSGINKLKDGLRDMALSDHQMNKMWDYVRQLWNRQQGRQMPVLVKQLPFSFRCEIMQAVYGSHIRESIIFNRTHDDFKRMVSMWLRHCVFFPGNYIVQCGDSDQCIYFIHRGEVEVLTVHQNLTESIYDVLGPEDSFGIAQGLFVGVAHHFSFRARTVVDVVYLQLDKWKYLLDFYPESAKIVQRKVENCYLAI